MHPQHLNKYSGTQRGLCVSVSVGGEGGSISEHCAMNMLDTRINESKTDKMVHHKKMIPCQVDSVTS